jgi:pyruvate kinase
LARKTVAIRRTKIVATLGPAWEEPDQMRALLDAGVNVVRINSSHGTPEIRTRWITDLKTVLKDRATACAILVDLQGPRIRVGSLPAPLTLAAKEVVTFAPEDSAGEGEIPTTYEGLAGDVRPGSRILLDDGLITVDVLEVAGSRVRGTVRYAGVLKAHKGMKRTAKTPCSPPSSEWTTSA